MGAAATAVALVVGAAGVLHESRGGSSSVVGAPSVVGAASAGSGAAGSGAAGSGARPTSAATPAAAAPVVRLPGVGPATLAKVPATTLQVVLVSAPSASSTANTVTLWQRSSPGAGWTQAGYAVHGRNGVDGWTPHHQEGDLRSPDGVFTLTYAGGRLANPGSRMPYEHNTSLYVAEGTFLGHDLNGAFDYLVAIDYNRVPGSPPSDQTRPLGEAAGGEIWLHVDHGSPTHGCVSVPGADVAVILHWLYPSAHPVIVMGDAPTLAA